jgi:tetraacyldisaccharide 4'-kinase
MRTAAREKIDLPVLCVGNFTVGGTGKTPVTIALAKQAQEDEAEARLPVARPWRQRSRAASRRPARDSARHVGDEPLLLAEARAGRVTPDRAAGARMLDRAGCDFIIMDDGFQSARIHIDYALLVVDGRYGIGNGHVMPRPARCARRWSNRLRFADADPEDRAKAMRRRWWSAWRRRPDRRCSRPVPRFANPTVAGRRFLAFAGIGHPAEILRHACRRPAATVVETRAFPDHHILFGRGSCARDAGRNGGRRGAGASSPPPRTRCGCGHGLSRGQARSWTAERAGDRRGVRGRRADVPQRIIDETLDAWRRRRLISRLETSAACAAIPGSASISRSKRNAAALT